MKKINRLKKNGHIYTNNVLDARFDVTEKDRAIEKFNDLKKQYAEGENRMEEKQEYLNIMFSFAILGVFCVIVYAILMIVEIGG